MKHIFYILLVVLAYGPVRAYAGKTGKTVSYLPVIGMKDQEVRKNGRSVELTMVVDLSGARIRTQHTVSLTPVLVSRDGRREAAFPPVVVDGGTRSKVYLRSQRLKSVELPPCHDGRAEVVIRRRNGTEQTYDYAAALPYERWMLDGRVELREEVHGCVNCASGESEQELMSDVLPGFVPEYRFAAILPEPEPVKARAETRTARLQFRQDSYTILPEFRNNRAELDTVSNSILLVKRNGDVEITGIYITGYASPEGSEAHNLVLSENRAKALAGYIRRHDGIAPELLHVEWRVRRGIGRLSAAAGARPHPRIDCEIPRQPGLLRAGIPPAGAPGDLPAAVERGLSPAAAQRVQDRIQRAQFRSGGGAADDRRAARPAESGGDVQGRRVL